MTRAAVRFLLLAALPVVVAAPTRAWNTVGHRVVAQIAWESMSEQARRAAVELLLAAPADSDLLQLLPADGRPAAERHSELFHWAAYWPDIVRDRGFRQRHEKYHHSNWHYVNYFWESTAGGSGRVLDRETVGLLIERLNALPGEIRDPQRPAGERGLALAWLLHLVGDVHQPLHATARVTATEPEGDRGGNEFQLDGEEDLHGYWDTTLSRGYRRWFWLSEGAYIRRIAQTVQERHPAAQAPPGAGGFDPDAWARESLEISLSSLYPPSLRRGERPDRAYRRQALAISEARIAVAGYRLARLLEATLGGP